ncbi:NADH:flavin oxidoreductase NADH oxidase [Pyrrhoderma noxium]|uniref:NADH:flavin oxidoreductase NADH oxidase n=1 Tax=Pyrrhoderma noxium TaxID=2282107 RepID=A0A286UEX0_9AGAM|nr:NADH:flavin oxidoreductase NADH oxidase [Pyrrhoderma noxium]
MSDTHLTDVKTHDTSNHLLFTPLKVGNVLLQHRIVMAPMTRYRADDDHIPTDMITLYYAQRASIWNKEQIAAWKKIVDAVHARGSFIFLQLWALGRYAEPDVLKREAENAGLPTDAFPYVSASNIPAKTWDGKTLDVCPRPLSLEEIDEYVRDYAQAAQNAIEAGFDGVEINNANGYLLDQFLQDVSNVRQDQYGGSIEKRSLFPLNVLDAIVSRIGASRTSIRLSPWNEYQGMRMADPIPTFSYITSEIRKRYPDLAYLHFVEGKRPNDSNDFARAIWKEGREVNDNNKREQAVFLSASKHDRESAFTYAEQGDVVVFGKWFLSNPDLPRRIKEDIPLNPYDYNTFYTKKNPSGYADYTFASS